MRILFLGFDIEGYGGIATYSRYQIEALKRLGHDADIVSIDKQTDGKLLAPGGASQTALRESPEGGRDLGARGDRRTRAL